MTSFAWELPGPIERLALGLVAPFDLELDRELWRWLPDDVDLLLSRTPAIDERVTIKFAGELAAGDDIGIGVRSVSSGRADVVAYACTSASFVGGLSGDEAIHAAMRAAGARSCVTTSAALVEALVALKVSRVAVVTPYTVDLSVMLDAYLHECGIEAVSNAALGLDHEIWRVSYAQTAELVRRADRPDVEAIVISCTNLPTYDIIAPLERELRKPIVAANQATMWAALGRMGRKLVGGEQRLAAVEPGRSSARPAAGDQVSPLCV